MSTSGNGQRRSQVNNRSSQRRPRSNSGNRNSAGRPAGNRSSNRNVNKRNNQGKGRNYKNNSAFDKVFFVAAVFLAFMIGIIVGRKTDFLKKDAGENQELAFLIDASPENVPEFIDVDIIPVNGVGRRGEKLETVNNIVIHYTGNPGTTAEMNHAYYTNPDTEVSSHFLVGMDGKVIMCVPLDEKSSATSERNRDTISIEVCHPDESGKYTEESKESLYKLVAWLCKCYGLGVDDVIRHYDATGKECPKYYVENPDEWDKLKEGIGELLVEKKKSLWEKLFN